MVQHLFSGGNRMENRPSDKMIIEEMAEKAIATSFGALGGMMLGEALSNPANAAMQHIKSKRDVLNMDPTKVIDLHSQRVMRNEEAAEMTKKQLQRSKLKSFVPKLGVPNSKAALVGGTLGAITVPLAIAEKKRAEERMIYDLQKEAASNYRNLNIEL